MTSQKTKKLDPVVTDSVLKSEFKGFEIRLDVKLQRMFQEFALEITTGIQRMFDEQDRKNEEKFVTKDEFREYKAETTSTLATIIGELKTIREEQIMGGYRQIQHTDQLENHELRITRAETHLHLTDK